MLSIFLIAIVFAAASAVCTWFVMNKKHSAILLVKAGELQAKEKELIESKANLVESKANNDQLCELISATNDRAAICSEQNEKLTAEKESLSQRISDIRNQLKNNTDLELATIDQIIDELKNRKSRFLLLRPGVNDGIDAVACQVNKQDAIGVLRAALQGLKAQESWKEGDDEDWTC